MHLANLILATGLILGSTEALVVKRCVGEGYGTLYDDNNCQNGASQAFSLHNAGCLANQNGRNSVYIQAACRGRDRSLVWSPGSTCNCQNNCQAIPEGHTGNGNFCWNLNGNPAASSFRFIEQKCAPNNC